MASALTEIGFAPQKPGGISDAEVKDAEEEDSYMRWKHLGKEIEFLNMQEEYIKQEMHQLRTEILRAQGEVQKIKAPPLMIGQFMEMVDDDYGVVGTSQSQMMVRILSTINREHLKANTAVAMHRNSHSVVEILPPEADSSVTSLMMTKKPDVTFNDIGGLDVQKQEVREAVELPLKMGHLYQQIGIEPPRGVLFYGPPGTGKTMMAKAVANNTDASFISVVGSEFVQKYLGEGPRMVRDVFRLARENAPSIVFIDEVDAIATKRFDAATGADREVQRILLELLNQMDGFDQATNVKVIMATNLWDTLDPALLRPGRLDRKVEFPHPDRRQRRLIHQVATSKMNLSESIDMEQIVSRPDKMSAAEIVSMWASAGLTAVRNNRYIVQPEDVEKAYQDIIANKTKEPEFYTQQ